ncbi:uncharacterized protein LOC132546268 [Ylistrum balloti]|uniref:uncharacterized protein LOC132546268 n=1 Tax=Ylistrum balloti TaxID=509963 RepID=UPI002905997C|nr:uncharacterized protein LOC132546268 [Ylistrum balloti]
MDIEQNVSKSDESLDFKGFEKNTPCLEFNQNSEDEENTSFLMKQKEDGYLQEQEIIDACQSINTSPRKRKIDKDGFVTPATPDIPKSSCHYGQTKQMRIDENANKEDEGYNTSKLTDHSPGQVSHGDCLRVSTPSQKDLQSVQSITDIINDMSEEANHIHQQFSKLFRECEEYEVLCPERLDKLIAEAKTLEENQNQQKQVMCGRLKVLSRTLQLL